MKLDNVIHAQRIPEDWHERILVLWREDECLTNDPSAEHVSDAVVRLRGSMYDCVDVFSRAPKQDDRGILRPTAGDVADRLLGPVLAEIDWGDDGAKLYNGGWVVGYACDGAWVGRVVLCGKGAR